MTNIILKEPLIKDKEEETSSIPARENIIEEDKSSTDTKGTLLGYIKKKNEEAFLKAIDDPEAINTLCSSGITLLQSALKMDQTNIAISIIEKVI